MATELEMKLNEIQEEKNLKIIPENIKKDVQIFDIIGAYEGSGSTTVEGAKIFTSVEEMMADTTSEEGAYGVVYGTEEISNITDGSSLFKIICNETVTFDTAITSSSYWYNDDYTFRVQLSATSARIQYTGNPSKTVSYTSTDGITYTTTATLEDRTIDLGGLTIESNYYEWDNNYNKFFVNIMPSFGGMYEYITKVSSEYYTGITNISLTDTTFNADNEQLYTPGLDTIMANLYTDKRIERVFVYYKNGKYYAQDMRYIIGMKSNDANNLYIGITSNLTDTANLYELDLVNMQYTLVGETSPEFKVTYDSNGNYVCCMTLNMNNCYMIGMFSMGSLALYKINFLIDTTPATSTSSYTFNYVGGHNAFLTWHTVSTQFTLNGADKLLPGLIALGKYGPVTGSDSVWNNIPTAVFLDRLGLKPNDKQAGFYGPPTEYASNVIDNNKITYLTPSNNGKMVIGKVKKIKDIIIDVGEYNYSNSSTWNHDYTYCANIAYSYTYSSSGSTYNYRLTIYNGNGELVYSRVMATDSQKRQYNLAFYNNILYLCESITTSKSDTSTYSSSTIYKLDCDTGTWSTHETNRSYVYIWANKYMITSNFSTSAYTPQLRITNLDTGAVWNFTESGNSRTAKKLNEMPVVAYHEDDTIIVHRNPGMSTSCYYYVTPTSAISFSGPYVNAYRSSFASPYAMRIGTNQLLIDYGTGTHLCVDISNLTAKTVTFSDEAITADYSSINSYNQLIYGRDGNLTIYNSEDLSISSDKVMTVTKEPCMINFDSDVYYYYLGENQFSVTFYGISRYMCFSLQNGKLCYEAFGRTEDVIFERTNAYPVRIEYTHCDTTDDPTAPYAVINALDSNKLSSRMNTIVLRDDTDNYTNTVTPEEYDTAIDTATEILGEEV